jgi:hypothetical protein
VHTSAGKSLAQLKDGIRAFHAIYNSAIPGMRALVSESTRCLKSKDLTKVRLHYDRLESLVSAFLQPHGVGGGAGGAGGTQLGIIVSAEDFMRHYTATNLGGSQQQGVHDGMGDNDADGLDLGEDDNDGHEAGGTTPADPSDPRHDSDPTVMFNVLANEGGRDFRNKAGIPQLLLKGSLPAAAPPVDTSREHEYTVQFKGPVLPSDSFGNKRVGRLPGKPAMRQDNRVGYRIGGLAGQVVKRYQPSLSLR